ncbi:DUF3152 domain-containing protein [Corynebacterium canis]|uniref:DUF3152 domain-containing protein n=1 Tax=Corynebacterium canis TaxID=679663 RepID=UPI001FE99405|nr:DUF3152 domain-containing protein [Corynebacterium canis]
MLVRFAREFGWRAYAIPVLFVITIWVFVDVLLGSTTDGATNTTADRTAATSVVTSAVTGRGSGPNPAESEKPHLATGDLPPGAPYAEAGVGTFRLVGAPGEQMGQGLERVFTYVVEIEDGIDTTVYGGDDSFAAMIDATLGNPKGWIGDPKFGFRHVGPDEEPDLRIQLASAQTTHNNCGFDIKMETSCFTSAGNRVILNESRWVRGALPFEGDLGSYRQYMVNHEVGHGIGFASHQPCAKDGELAPIMMQQTLSVNNSELHGINPEEVYPDDNATCATNPWPFPHAG